MFAKGSPVTRMQSKAKMLLLSATRKEKQWAQCGSMYKTMQHRSCQHCQHEVVKNEEKTYWPKENDDSDHNNITAEESIVVEDKVFATYSDFMKFINSSEQYDDEWDIKVNNRT